MFRKTVSGIMLIMLLMGMLTLAFNIRPVKASGTIYIRADGSIDPPTTLISTVDNFTYTLTGNITSDAYGIVIERNNMTLDGADCYIQGSGSGYGILLSSVNNVTVRGTDVQGFIIGVDVYNSTDCHILENNITNNWGGIYLGDTSCRTTVSRNSISSHAWYGMGVNSPSNNISLNNIANNGHWGIVLGATADNNVFGNNITNNAHVGYSDCAGFWLWESFDNGIFENCIADNYRGMLVEDSYNNRIYHNNFNDSVVYYDYYDLHNINSWDDGYPSGGNHWRDYIWGQDLNGDGIGDTPYGIEINNIDRYPLMRPWGLQIPLPNFIYSEQPLVNETVTFDASSTYDRDGFIVDYRWNFGDGNTTNVADPITTHVYTAQGAYTTNLTVTDNSGLKSSIVGPITIKLYHSTITLNLNATTVLVGSRVAINGTLSPIRVNANVTILDKLSGGDWTVLTTVRTDSDGNYTYVWKTRHVGENEIKATWTGDENTWSAESEIKTIDVQEWGYTIYIRADGSFDPPTAPIHCNGDFYTFTDDIYVPIVVERNNTIINGAGYTLQGSGTGFGFTLPAVTNVAVKSTNIQSFWSGICLESSSNNIITGNNITKSGVRGGIYLSGSFNNSIFDNNITNNWNGICLYYSSNNNTIFGNNIANNDRGVTTLYGSSNNTISENKISNSTYIGIWLSGSFNTIFENDITNNNVQGIVVEEAFNNLIHHNNFIDNTQQVYDWSLCDPQYTAPSINVWDDGYPSGGNYWSDYTRVDEKNGVNQDQPGGDGIGDIPYTIDESNQDRYPLMKPYGSSHDIGITAVTPSKSVIGQGYNANITIRVMNYGMNTETFNLTAHINTTLIATFTNMTLPSRNSITLTFMWNTTGFAKGNYTIWANATSVLGETDHSDNTLVDDIVSVGVPCDMTGPTSSMPDGICNMTDIDYACQHFGTTPSSPNWDPNADVTGPIARVPDDIVNMRDIGEACSQFMKPDP